MKKLSLEEMERVEGGWPAWLGGTYKSYAPGGCIEYRMPDGTVAHENWGTENSLWGLVQSEYKMLDCDMGPC